MKKLLPLALLLLFLSGTKKTRPSTHGLVLSDDDLEVVDWNLWMAWSPQAVREALDDGAENGQQIAAHMMRRIFPARQWPPGADDKLAARWRALVRGIDRTLATTTPEDDERSNVISFRR
jgi:hypothetical protein